MEGSQGYCEPHRVPQTHAEQRQATAAGNSSNRRVSALFSTTIDREAEEPEDEGASVFSAAAAAALSCYVWFEGTADEDAAADGTYSVRFDDGDERTMSVRTPDKSRPPLIFTLIRQNPPPSAKT